MTVKENNTPPLLPPDLSEWEIDAGHSLYGKETSRLQPTKRVFAEWLVSTSVVRGIGAIISRELVKGVQILAKRRAARTLGR